LTNLFTAGARAPAQLRHEGEAGRRGREPGWLWLNGRAFKACEQDASSGTASPRDAVIAAMVLALDARS